MTSNPVPSETPGPQVSPGRPRRVTRSRQDRKIAGVAGGLGQYFGIDPLLVRLGFVVAALMAGSGVLGYLIAWIVLPKAGPGEDRPGTHGGLRSAIRRLGAMDGTTVLAVILLVAATLVVLIGGDFGGSAVVAAALIGFGIYVLHQGGSSAEPARAGSGESPSAAPDDSPVIRSPDDAPARVAPGAAAATAAAILPPEPVVREPATVTRLTLSAVALFFAGALLFDRLGWVDTDASTVIAIGLVAVGAAAVVAAIVGHGRGLAPAGAVLSLAFAVSLVAQPAFENGVGERIFAPTDSAVLAPAYELGVGRLELDLRELQLGPGEQAQVRVELGIGEAVVRMPAEVDLVVTGEVGLGELSLLGQSQDGIRNELSADDEGSGDSTIVVDLTVGVGQGVVQRG